MKNLVNKIEVLVFHVVALTLAVLSFLYCLLYYFSIRDIIMKTTFQSKRILKITEQNKNEINLMSE